MRASALRAARHAAPCRVLRSALAGRIERLHHPPKDHYEPRPAPVPRAVSHSQRHQGWPGAHPADRREANEPASAGEYQLDDNRDTRRAGTSTPIDMLRPRRSGTMRPSDSRSRIPALSPTRPAAAIFNRPQHNSQSATQSFGSMHPSPLLSCGIHSPDCSNYLLPRNPFSSLSRDW